MKMLARRISGLVLRRRVGEKDRDVARQTCGMRQQMMDGDRCVLRLDLQPRQIIENRLVQIELAFFVKL